MSWEGVTAGSAESGSRGFKVARVALLAGLVIGLGTANQSSENRATTDPSQLRLVLAELSAATTGSAACSSTQRSGIALNSLDQAIQGCFLTTDGRSRPYVDASLQFPSIGRRLDVSLMLDTGADRTVLGPSDASRLGIDFTTLPRGQTVGGVGGQTDTRTIEAMVGLESVTLPITLTVLDPSSRQLPIPSLLGRDVLVHFALFLNERKGQVLLFDAQSSATVSVP